MATINDGGPAFPIGSGDMRDPTGITMRDYFAAQALAGQQANPETRTWEPRTHALWAYRAADAMIAERAKAGGQ